MTLVLTALAGVLILASIALIPLLLGILMQWMHGAKEVSEVAVWAIAAGFVIAPWLASGRTFIIISIGYGGASWGLNPGWRCVVSLLVSVVVFGLLLRKGKCLYLSLRRTIEDGEV